MPRKNKFAAKPKALDTALETIKEDEDLATTLSTWQIPNSLSSKAFQNATKRGRRRKAKVSLWESELIRPIIDS